jgi:putative transposase
VLKDSPFAGEGYRKVRARLHREHGIHVSGKRVLRLLRREGLLAWTRVDGWVWVFALVDHYTAAAWAHVVKLGDRFAALEPVYDAVVDRWGQLGPDVARGLELRHDWGPQYRSAHFTGSLAWLGITDSPAFVGEPETGGCAERWIRTLKDQCLWVKLHDTVDELRQAVAGFVDRYNSSWLIQRHGHHGAAAPPETDGVGLTL